MEEVYKTEASPDSEQSHFIAPLVGLVLLLDAFAMPLLDVVACIGGLAMPFSHATARSLSQPGFN